MGCVLFSSILPLIWNPKHSHSSCKEWTKWRYLWNEISKKIKCSHFVFISQKSAQSNSCLWELWSRIFPRISRELLRPHIPSTCCSKFTLKLCMLLSLMWYFTVYIHCLFTHQVLKITNPCSILWWPEFNRAVALYDCDITRECRTLVESKTDIESLKILPHGIKYRLTQQLFLSLWSDTKNILTFVSVWC